MLSFFYPIIIVPSTQSKLFYYFLRAINKKASLQRQLHSGKPSFFDCPEPTSTVRKVCNVAKFQVAGHNAFILTPKNTPNTGKHILYLHGGAYIQSFSSFHWRFLAELVDRTGCTITAPDYPLAPSHNFENAFKMVSVLYENILAKVAPEDFILMGDSSGGGFALALAQKMKNENILQPNRIILLSPWLDLTLANPEIVALEPHDPFLEKKSLQQAGILYARGAEPSLHLLSPINGSLNGLGKISLFSGSKEILVADSRKLNYLAGSIGCEISYYEYEDMVHGWMFLSFPESKAARKQIIELIQDSV
jgi:epsilon-lactone hydrolase